MNNRRYDGMGLTQNSDGTLNRLNQALSALENRLGNSPRTTQQRPSYGSDLNDVASIRAREAELRGQVAQQNAAAEQAASFDALRDEIRSLQNKRTQNPSAVADLRADIDSLKFEVLKLARQDALNDLSERWGVIEHEIARMPETLASRDDLNGMASRIDELQRAVTAMPASMETRALEERIQTLAAAMEAFGEQQAGFERNLFNGVDERLSVIDRAISGFAQNADGADRDALERIEARISALTRQIEDAHGAELPDYTPLFNDMAQRLDALQAVGGGDPAVHEALTLIAERVAELQHAPTPVAGGEQEMAALSQRLDHIVALLEHQPASAGHGIDAASLTEIEARLESLGQQLSHSTENTGKSVELAVASLEGRITDLARMLDSREEVFAPSAMPLSSVEERLDDIARFLTQQAETTSVGAEQIINTEALEQQIAELTARLSDSSSAFSTGQASVESADVMEAARIAAEQVLANANSSAVDSADVSRLSEDLKALEVLARESDGRNERTFEAIHDTLLKIVDHLSDLEVKAAPDNPLARPADTGTTTPTEQTVVNSGEDEALRGEPVIPPQSGLNSTPPTGRLPIDDAPSMDGPIPAAPQRSLTPAQAAADAAIAAMSQTASDTIGEQASSEQPKKNLLQAMTDRFKKGDQDDGVLSNDPPLGSDVPLEPGTAEAEVAEIIARVRRERGEAAPATPSSPVAPLGDEPSEQSSSKSDFIAAARRAAQAAASDAQAAETRTASKSNGLKNGVASILSTKRRPILVGAAAILLALLALPFVRGFVGGGDTEVAIVPDTPPSIEQVVDTAPSAVQVPDLNGANVVESEDALLDAPRVVGEAYPTDSAEQVQPTDEFNEEVAGDTDSDQVATEDITAAIPTTAGTVAMQEAARSGDSKAIFLVGDYFAAKAQTGAVADATKHKSDALAWYTKAAEAGYAPAQQRLGSLYEKGIGTDRDLQLAKSWYQLAAEQGNAPAMHNLGVLYANGVDGAPDLVQAVSWFEQAALFGVRDSQYNLGVMSVRGDGMEPNLAESYKWFSLAAASGDADAASKRDTVAERMDPETLEKARDDVALWRPRTPDQAANIVDVPEAWQTDEMRTAAAAPSEPLDMEKAVRNIQAILNANGYDAGPVDGIMGGKTVNAIKSFQAANGMQADGQVSEELVRKLLALAG